LIDKSNSQLGESNGTEEPAQRQLRVKNEKELHITFCSMLVEGWWYECKFYGYLLLNVNVCGTWIFEYGLFWTMEVREMKL